jgi:putative spermidine/putrescine transport system permease protein
MSDGKRSLSFYLLAGFFGLYVLFLYGPTITIAVLSFQGPNGGLTFPLNGVSFHWFANLFQPQLVGDFGGSVERSLLLGAMVMIATMVVSLAAGFAYRKRFKGDTPLF